MACNQVQNAAGKSGAALWSLPGGEERGARLETELKGHTGDVRAVRWHPSDETCLATVAEGELRVWNVAGASAKASFWSSSIGFKRVWARKKREGGGGRDGKLQTCLRMIYWMEFFTCAGGQWGGGGGVMDSCRLI